MVLYFQEFDKSKACILNRRISSLSQKVCQSGLKFGTVLLYLNAMGILSIFNLQQSKLECAFSPTIWLSVFILKFD